MLTVSELMAVSYDGCVDNYVVKANLSISTEIITVIFAVILWWVKNNTYCNWNDRFNHIQKKNS